MLFMIGWRGYVSTTLSLVALSAGCRETTKPLVPASVLVVSGDGQIAPAGQAIVDPLVVRVVDSSGHGVSGRSVTWTVTSGGGSVAAASTTTDASGLASMSWTLGTAGGTNAMTAEAAGLPSVSFSASAYLFVDAIAPGYAHACALGYAGLAYCWGEIFLYPPPQLATLVPGGLRFTSLTASENICGITSDGTAYCWGSNRMGQNGNGSTDSSLTPVPVSGGLKFASLSAGSFDTCGVTVSGDVYCWGGSYVLPRASSTPVLVPGGLRFSSVSVSYGTACGLTTDGAVYCWGWGSTTPVRVVTGLTFVSVTVGYSHQCGLTATGLAYCWGSNSWGQFGTGDTSWSATPVPVSGNHTFTSVSTRWYHTCGTTVSGAAYCWGQNNEGEIGDGAAGAAVLTPTPVLGGLTFASVNTNTESTCGLTTNGAAYCWGYNAGGQVGDGTVVHALVPTRVVAPGGVNVSPPARSNAQRGG